MKTNILLFLSLTVHLIDEVFNRKCSESTASDDAAAHIPHVALYFIDLKVEVN